MTVVSIDEVEDEDFRDGKYISKVSVLRCGIFYIPNIKIRFVTKRISDYMKFEWLKLKYLFYLKTFWKCCDCGIEIIFY